MTGEGFAYYSQKYPVCFYRIGTKNNNNNIVYNLHSSNFQLDEKSIKFATGLMAYITASLLNQNE